MRRFSLWLSILTIAILTGCADDNPISFSPEDQEGATAKLTLSSYPAGSARLRVMTRNLYLGTSINPILAAPPEQIPLVMAQGWAEVLSIDFNERAAALADEIVQFSPHLIGLQEAAIFRLQSPGDYLQGNPQPAEEVVFDYLEILLNALEERGLDYRPVAVTTCIDIELPAATSPALDDLRFTDREVILARADVRVTHSQSGLFAAGVPVNVGGMDVLIQRGWASVDARVAGQSFRFLSTHLETSTFSPIQIAQGAELVAMARDLSMPLVMVGDFNSAADRSRTPTYGNLVDAGFVDVWEQANSGAPGYTCCHDDDLRNEEVDFNRRIDLIFVYPTSARNPVRKVDAEVIGEEEGDQTSSGMWPSDHAGVRAAFRLQPVPRSR